MDLVKSPQMSAVAVVAGLGCGQDTVAPPELGETAGWTTEPPQTDAPRREGPGQRSLPLGVGEQAQSSSAGGPGAGRPGCAVLLLHARNVELDGLALLEA